MERLTVALLVLCLAAAPATRPATRPATTKPTGFTDFKSLLKQCPSDKVPARGETWKTIHQQLVNDWMRDRVTARQFTGTLKFSAAFMHGPEAEAAFEIEPINFLGLKLSHSQVRVKFTKSAAESLAKLKPGTRVKISGTFDYIAILGNVDENQGAQLSATMIDGKLDSDKPRRAVPATRPATAPVR